MLTETSRGRRLFRNGDDFHPPRSDGKITPNPDDIPARYRDLLRWYQEQFSWNLPTSAPADSPLRGAPASVLLEFAGSIPSDDLQRMQKVIEQECEQIDTHEW